MAAGIGITGATISVSCSSTYVSKITKFEEGDTSSTTATPSGGIGSYTYAWTIESDGGNLAANSPTAASTSFHWVGLFPLDETSSDFRCTATDSLGNTGYQIITVYVARTEFE